MISLSLTLVINCYTNTGQLRRSELPEGKCLISQYFASRPNLPVSLSTFGSTGRGLELTQHILFWMVYSQWDFKFLINFSVFLSLSLQQALISDFHIWLHTVLTKLCISGFHIYSSSLVIAPLLLYNPVISPKDQSIALPILSHWKSMIIYTLFDICV